MESKHWTGDDTREFGSGQDEERDELRERAERLVDALVLCLPHITAQSVLCQAHGVPYTGPTFGKELDALRELLAK